MQLLDNAIKFTPPGKTVGFKLILEKKFACVNVFDMGYRYSGREGSKKFLNHFTNWMGLPLAVMAAQV